MGKDCVLHSELFSSIDIPYFRFYHNSLYYCVEANDSIVFVIFMKLKEIF